STALLRSSMKRWRPSDARVVARSKPNSIGSAASFCRSAIRPTRPPRKGRLRLPSRSRVSRGRAASASVRRCRSPNSINPSATPVDAHAVLAPALEGFWPTPEMPEIGQAQSLLAALAETDEVKAEAARRQQRRQLHVAYGNALFAARGPGAPETAQAFAKGHASAVGDNDAHGRLSADFGLWVGSYVRGELAAMREHSKAFLSDVEARPDSPEAGVAHRMAGITHWFAGEYVEAREHIERALALFQPGRD